MDTKKAIKALLEAENSKIPIDPFTDHLNITKEEAYTIQLGVIDAKVQAGLKIVGKKIGLTSKAMQEMLGVDVPDYGHLLNNMIYEETSPISIDDFIQPKVEFEIGFVLKESLQGPGVTIEDVIKATDYVVPAIEIIDSRIKDWKIKFEDTVADNGSSAGAIIGREKVQLKDLDLPNVEMELYKNNEIMDHAFGSAVMGNPLHAIAWLANEIGTYHISLNPGEIILAGALSKALLIESGDTFKAVFKNLGSVQASFEK